VITRPGEIRPADRSVQNDGPVRGLHLFLLRDFDLTDDGVRICVSMSGQRVLAYLALRERPCTRIGLAGTLWAETPEDRAMANLRSALWRLNRPGVRLVEATSTHVTLAPEIAVDLRELIHAAVAAVDKSGPIDPQVMSGVAQADELLPGWYDDWVVFERERFRQLRLHALESLCSRLADEGEYALAIDMGLAAVAADPLRETARRALIRAFLAEGNRAEAIAEYLSYRRLLRMELDVAPSGHLEAMIESLR
jgi:DNA-binding SARP family transcriptional activator